MERNYNKMHTRLCSSANESTDKVVGLGLLLCGLFILKVLENMGLLLPEVNSLLVLHMALGIRKVCHVNILNVSVSLKLLSNLCANDRCWSVNVVHFCKLADSSEVLSVKLQDA